MAPETEDLNSRLTTAQIFSRLLPDTPQKFLGLYNDGAPQDSREAALRNHLMVRRNYEALVSGDGACAGCGEKSILRAAASVTEAYMRPLYHQKADRLRAKADRLEKEGLSRLEAIKQRSEPEYHRFRRAVAHIIMGLGGENDADTIARIASYETKHGPISDEQIVNGIVAVLRQDAFNHRDLNPLPAGIPCREPLRVHAFGARHSGLVPQHFTAYGSLPMVLCVAAALPGSLQSGSSGHPG